LRDQGKYDEARRLYERAQAIEIKVLGPEHPSVATSLNNLGALLKAQGKYAGARRLYERALAITEKALGAEHRSVAMRLNNLAVLLEEQGKYDEARPLHDRALAIFEKVLGRDHPDVASSLNNLAGLLRDQGKYDEARRLYERAQAIEIKVLGPEHRSVARSLNALALLLAEQGKYDEARRLYDQALAIYEKVLGAEHPYMASNLNNLAALVVGQGKYDEARPLLDRALAIREKALGAEHPDVANSLNNLAEVLRSQGKYDEAQPLYERALAIDQKALGPEHPSVATSLNNLALLLEAQGRYDGARRLYERALAISEKAMGREHPQVASYRGNLASLVVRRGNYDEARPLLGRALAIREKALGPEHPDVAGNLSQLAQLHLDTGQSAAALTHARTLQQRGRSRLLSQLTGASESDAFRYAAERQWQLPLLLSAARGESSAAVECFNAIVSWKGQVSRFFGQRKQRLLARLTAEERATLERLRSVQGALSNLLAQREIKDGAEHARNLARLRKERDQLGAALQQSGAATLHQESVTAAKIAASLPEGAVWIDFLEHNQWEPAQWLDGKFTTPGEWGERQLTAWVVKAGPGANAVEAYDRVTECIHVPLGPSAPIRAAIAAIDTTTIDARGLHISGDPGDEASVRSDLHKLLWEPLAKHVGAAQRVFVCPDSFLTTLPFEVIADASDQYLIEKHSFAYLRDGAALLELARPRPEPALPKLCAAGAIDYDGRTDETGDDAGDEEGEASPGKSLPEGIVLASARRDGDFEHHWHALAATSAEVDGIHTLHETTFGAATRLLVRAGEATEERLKAELPKYSMIHLATHGYFQPAALPSAWESAQELVDEERDRLAPATDLGLEHKLVTGYLPSLLSGIVCAGANSERDPTRDNGLLTAEEVSWLDLGKCDLVVLSACETAIGTTRSGEGMMSLRRAFHQAGAKAVISSLWKVPDEPTRKLMLRFYERLWNQKQGKLEALRGAQLDMLSDNRKKYGKALPATWGAFVLSGDWR
ncbi:MAG: tetratricopeptide repeat protein, partial [Planctomycetota bacterium]